MKIKYYYPRGKEIIFSILDSKTEEAVTPVTVTINGTVVNYIFENNTYKIQAPYNNRKKLFSIKVEALDYNVFESDYSYSTLNKSTILMFIPEGLFDFRFYKNKVWDVLREPAFPSAEVGQKITINGLPFKDEYTNKVKESDFYNGNYISLVNRNITYSTLDTSDYTQDYVKRMMDQSTALKYSGVNLDDICIVATALFDSSGNMIEYIGDYGVLWGLGKEGFLFTDYSAKERGTFFFMEGTWNINDVLNYTPEYTIVTSLEVIEDYFKDK